MGDIKNSYIILIGKTEGKVMFDRIWRRWTDIEMDRTEIRYVKRELDFSG